MNMAAESKNQMTGRLAMPAAFVDEAEAAWLLVEVGVAWLLLLLELLHQQVHVLVFLLTQALTLLDRKSSPLDHRPD
jgi:hypothetical protein